MILLSKITINNFLSHEETIVDFSPITKLLIDGKSGSGKSSIVEALVWCFYGKSRTDNRNIIKRGKKFASVTIDFFDGKDEYRLNRHVSAAGKQTLQLLNKKNNEKNFVIMDVGGLKDLQLFIENDLLRSSYLLFINSVVYPQDNQDNFIKQTATKRKELLLEIINASLFDGYLENIKSLLAEYTAKVQINKSIISSLEDKISEKTKFLSDNEDVDKKFSMIAFQLSELSVKKDKIIKDLAKLEASKESLERVIERKNIVDVQIKEVVNEIASTESFLAQPEEKTLKEIEAITKNINELSTRLVAYDKLSEDVSEWQRKYLEIIKQKPSSKEFDTEIAKVNDQIISLMSKDLGICEEINKPCPIIKIENDKQVLFWTKSLSELKNERDEYADRMSLYMQKTEELGDDPKFDPSERRLVQNDLTAFRTELERLKDEKSKYGVLASELAGLKAKLIEKKNDEVNIDKEIALLGNVDITSMEAKEKEKVEILMEIAGLEGNKVSFASIIEMKKMAGEEVVSAKSEIKKLKAESKFDVEVLEGLEQLKVIFGRSGLRAMVIDSFIPLFEERINDILKKLSDFRVKIDTQRETISGDSVVDGLFITITNDVGEDMDFDNFSGGEKLKITVAICEALSSVQRVGFRFLDELFVGLDDESIDSFVDVVASLQGEFSQLVCISHLNNIKDLFDERILISKTGGTSKSKTYE